MGNTHVKDAQPASDCTKAVSNQLNRTQDGVISQSNVDSKIEDSKTVDDDSPIKIGDSKTVDDFCLLSLIGKGNFGKVYMVRKKSNDKIFAMKVLKKDLIAKKQQVEHTQTERDVLANITHPFIVSLRYAFQTSDKLYMVVDFYTGGELFFHLKNSGVFSHTRVRFYVAEIICAIECLHSHNIIYRDLKPENVLLDNDGHIKLTDFGLSKNVRGSTITHTFCGTPEYLAPEILTGHSNNGYNKAVDWWSLGSLVFEMLTGLPPFYSNNTNLMYKKILSSDISFPDTIPPLCRDFISRLLEKNPEKRLGAGPSDAQELKEHEYFEGINWDYVNTKRYEPPFKPSVSQNKDDLSNIDKEFTNCALSETPAVFSKLVSKSLDFPDFTYVDRESMFSITKK